MSETIKMKLYAEICKNDRQYSSSLREREREREDRYDGRLLTSGLNWKEKMERKEAWKAYRGN